MNKHRDIYTRSQVIHCGMASHVRFALYDPSSVRYARISEITCVQIVRTTESL